MIAKGDDSKHKRTRMSAFFVPKMGSSKLGRFANKALEAVVAISVRVFEQISLMVVFR